MWLPCLLACTGEIVHHPEQQEETAVAAFSITSVEPDQGPEGGGTFVRVVGTGFSAASAVAVGGAPCTTFTFLSSNEVFCTTPAGSLGEVALTIHEGSDEVSSPFTYAAGDPDTADTGQPEAEIGGCTLDAPEALTAEEWSYSDDVFGSVTVAGRTGFETAPIGVEGEAGWGPPEADPDTWAWSELDFLAAAGAASQYSGGLSVDDRGSYAFSVRFRVDHGPWALCTNSAGGQGALEVVPDQVEEPVDYCHVQWPCELVGAVGELSPDVYAWIYQSGVSQGPGQGVGVLFDLGVGNSGTDPESDLSWRWSPMTYYADKDGLSEGDQANDEYLGNFIVPESAGTYDYTARASADDGLSWTLCDLGGDSCNFGGSSDGYDDPGVCVAE